MIEMSCFGGGQDEALKEQRRQNKLIDAQLKKDKDVYKATHRLLLLGTCMCVCVYGHVWLSAWLVGWVKWAQICLQNYRTFLHPVHLKLDTL